MLVVCNEEGGKPIYNVPPSQRLQILPDHFQTAHVSCLCWEEEPDWFCVARSGVKITWHSYLWNYTVFAKSQSWYVSCLWWGGKRHWSRPKGTLALCETVWAWYTLSFAWSLPNFTQLSWEEEPYLFWITRSKVKVNFGTPAVKPHRHDAEQGVAKSLPNFTCICKLSLDKKRNFWFGINDKGQFSHCINEILLAPLTADLPNHLQTSHENGFWLVEFGSMSTYVLCLWNLVRISLYRLKFCPITSELTCSWEEAYVTIDFGWRQFILKTYIVIIFFVRRSINLLPAESPLSISTRLNHRSDSLMDTSSGDEVPSSSLTDGMYIR